MSPELKLQTSLPVQDRAHPESAYPYGFADYLVVGPQPTVAGDPAAAACPYSGRIIPFTKEEVRAEPVCIPLPTDVIDE